MKIKNIYIHTSIPLSFKKMLCIFLVVCFFATWVCRDAIAVIAMPEIQTSEYGKYFNDFILPHNYGKITKAHFSATDRIIINIQDFHCHPNVQKNISNIIELFDKKYGITDIYLEGAYCDISTKWLVQNLNDKNKTEVLDNVLKTGMLTGAEYYSAISDKTEIIKGLENKEPYLDNLKRFADILEKQDEIQLILKAVDEETEKIKNKYYDKNQLRLEKLLKKYESGKIKTDKYYRLLSKYTDKLGKDLSKYKNTVNYINLLKLQKQLNYQNVQKDIQNLMLLLKQELPYQKYSMLLAETDNLKRTDILSAYIMQISREYNIELAEKFSQLNNYFCYIEINKNINPIELFEEQESLIAEINAMFFKDKKHKEIIFLISFEKYLKQYLTTKITPDGYDYYKQNRAEYERLWNKYADNKLLTLLKPYITEIDKFYEINTDRNKYFAEHIFKGIETNKIKNIKEGKDEINKIINNMEHTKRIDVVVTGGFHSQTVTDILQQHGVSYIVITPNIQGDIKKAEETYYTTAKQQKEFEIQTLATLPFSVHGKNYQIAVAIQAFPKQAEEIFGKDEVERVKRLNIKIKESDIKKAKDYKKQIEEEIDISKMLQSDDIGIEDLEKLIKNIGSVIFSVDQLDKFSQQDMLDISKSVARLVNNREAGLVSSFFYNLEYEEDWLFFKILKAFKSDKSNMTQSVKIAMKKYLELTDYNYYVLEDIFEHDNMADSKLKNLLKIFLEKDSNENYKYKTFIEDNSDLIVAINLNYENNEANKIFDMFFTEYNNFFMNDKNIENDMFIYNVFDAMKKIVEKKHSPEQIQNMLNLFFEKDENGNYKREFFMAKNRYLANLVKIVCMVYGDDLNDLEYVLNLFFEKYEENKAFIATNSQISNLREQRNETIKTIIKQKYSPKDLEKILDMVLTQDEDGNYIYSVFLENISNILSHYLAVYRPISKEMLELLLEYKDSFDVYFNLTVELFNILDRLPQKEKTEISKRLADLLIKYCQTENLMDNYIVSFRNFVFDNMDTATSKKFAYLILSELEKDKQIPLNKETNIFLQRKKDIVEFAINNFSLFEKVGLSEQLFDLLFDNINNINIFITDIISDADVDYGVEDKITSLEKEFIEYLIDNYTKLSKSQKEKLAASGKRYVDAFIYLTDNYDDKEISHHPHHTNEDWSFFSITDEDGLYNETNKKNQYKEKFSENQERRFTKLAELVINNKDKFNIAPDKLKKVENRLKIISQIPDFEWINNKFKKMFIEGQLEYQVNLKEYCIDEEAKLNEKVFTKKGKNPPIERDLEIAKTRNWNDVKETRKLFNAFISSPDIDINDRRYNEIFKRKTSFSIKEIIENENLEAGKKTYKKHGDYESGDVLEVYADDIVYAIATIMRDFDKQGYEKNKSFNELTKKAGIKDGYKFTCPLFDGQCLVPFSEILKAGYDIGDCTGDFADGMNNVDFRNNRIYTKNHFLIGYYEDEKFIQKYALHFNNETLHIFSLEDIGSFRPGISEKTGEYGGEYKNVDSEGVYFLESIDFIVSDFVNKINNEKEGFYKDVNINKVYIETGSSSSDYLKKLATLIVTDESSGNKDLLYQSTLRWMKKLDLQINLKDKIEEQKKIAKRNKFVRLLLNQLVDSKRKLEQENRNVRAKIKDDKFIIEPNTEDDGRYENFIEHFIEILDEYIPLYKHDDVYAVKLNEDKMLEMIPEDEKIVQTTKQTSRFTRMDEENIKKEFNVASADEVLSLDNDEKYAYIMPQINEILNNNKESNLRFFKKDKSFNADKAKVEILKIKEADNKVIMRINDGQGSVYYAETDIRIVLRKKMNIKVKNYDKNIINDDNEILDKEQLLKIIRETEVVFKRDLARQLPFADKIIVEFPPIESSPQSPVDISALKQIISDILGNKKELPCLAVYAEQLTPDLLSWADKNNVKLLVIENKKDNYGKSENIAVTDKNIRYTEKNNYTLIFSKKGIEVGEIDNFKEDLEQEFGDIEIAQINQSDKEIISNFERKYNITKTEKEINNLVYDKLGGSEMLKENIAQTDLIKDLLSAS